MDLTSGTSSVDTYSSTRFPICMSPATAAHAPTVVAVKKRVAFAPTAEILIPSPPPTVQFDIPYTINLFFRNEVQTLQERFDTPSVHLVLDDVPPAALPGIRVYIENINDHAKIDYAPTTKQLMITCASAERNFMAGIGREMMTLISSNDNAFTGNNPDYKIIENYNTAIPLGNEKHGRQPDGGLRLLKSGPLPPFLVWEVLDSQPLSQMIEKIEHYFTQSRGRIRVVIVIQLIRRRAPKRKRRHNSIGDGRPELCAESDESEQTLPHPPPIGRLIQGFYWVYKHGVNAAGHRIILCAAERVEFYPVQPEGVLTLTWADILKTVPTELADKRLCIPFSILHDLFRMIVDAAAAPVVFEPEVEEEEMWELGVFPGIEASEEVMGSEEEESEVGDWADSSFEGGAEPVRDGGAVRQSGRLAGGGA